MLNSVRTGGRAAFTLIEMLIVIVILAILAMVIIPQISTSTADAKLSRLQADLRSMRQAVDLYYAQHNSVYPGAVLGGAQNANAAFSQQLTRYTDIAGTIYSSRNSMNKFGPYLKGASLPVNPFNNKSDVVVDTVVNNITTKTSDGSTGWKFYALTGVFMANDGAHDGE